MKKRFEEREYQKRMINDAMRDLVGFGTSLWGAPTGCGKAFTLSRLVGCFLEQNRRARILIVIDQENLVRQLHSTFTEVNRGVDTGIVCAGVSKTFDLHSKVLIASRQSLYNKIEQAGHFDLVIGDEAHEWRLLDKSGQFDNSQFHHIMRVIKRGNKDALLHGCTATPYRLKDGVIYGEQKANGATPLFKRLSTHITYQEMFENGYLVKPIFYKQSRLNRENIKKSSTGEFVSADAERVMNAYTDSAIEAIFKTDLKHCKCPICFCVNISHAKSVYDKMLRAGLKANIMHSQNRENYKSLERYITEGGWLVTVDQANKGFDHPPADGALLLRPICATSICIQQVGRVVRFCEEKGEVPVVDLVGNIETHLEGCDLDRPIVREPKQREPGPAELKELGFKRCGRHPDCKARLKLNQVECPECGYTFQAKVIKNMPIGELVKYQHGSKELYTDIEIEKIEKREVVSAEGKKRMLVAFTGTCGTVITISMFFRDQYPGSKSLWATKKQWSIIFKDTCPYKTSDAIEKSVFKELTALRARRKNGFWSIIDAKYNI